jgi:hypothetical protein
MYPGPTRKHSVEVWGQSYEIETQQQSKTVWIAYGDYMGEHIQTKDQTRGAAIQRWRDRARSIGG